MSIASGGSKSPADRLLLAIDTGSPVTSAALGTGGQVVAERRAATRTSSARLLRLIDELLDEAGCSPADLGGLVALRGPGSFTGLRVGLATVIGLRSALGIPAAAFSTFEALAASVPPGSRPRVAVVDALRGEWHAQVFSASDPATPRGPAALVGPPRISALAPCTVVGFGVEELESTPGWDPGARLHRPSALAPTALRLAVATDLDRDPSDLTSPLYLRPPAARPPSR